MFSLAATTTTRTISRRVLPLVATTALNSSSAAASSCCISTSAAALTSSTFLSSSSSHRHWRYFLGMATAAVVGTSVTMSTLATAEAKQSESSSSSASSSSSPNDDGIYLKKLLTPSTGKPLTVLVACGSYSPLTNMHLLVFEQARNFLQFETNRYDVIGGFISPVHDAYGKKSLIPQRLRYEMCVAAVDNSDWISVQEWEQKQKGWTTTATTLCKYQEALNRAHLTEGQAAACECDPIRVKLLCGADLLESTLIPNLWSNTDLDLIFGTFGVVVIERAGLDLAHLISSNPTLAKYSSHIDIVPQRITNTISSTSVRNLIASQQSIKYLTPEKVIEYIYKHGLYGHDASKHPQKVTYLKTKD